MNCEWKYYDGGKICVSKISNNVESKKRLKLHISENKTLKELKDFSNDSILISGGLFSSANGGGHVPVGYAYDGKTKYQSYKSSTGVPKLLMLDNYELVLTDSPNYDNPNVVWAREGKTFLVMHGEIDMRVNYEHTQEIKNRDTRVSITFNEDYIYMVVCTENDGYKGLTSLSLANFCKDELGCKYAIEFDGGGTGQEYDNDNKEYVVRSTDGTPRKMTDCFSYSYQEESESDDFNEDFIVAIGAGHYLHQSGKETIETPPTKEWILNNKVAEYATEMFKPYKVKVVRIDDPTGETNVPYSDRPKIASEAGADVYYADHHNAAGVDVGTGVEVFRSKDDNTGLADLLVEKMSDYTGLRNRGVKTRLTSSGNDYYAEIRNAYGKTKAYLLEGGFMTTWSDVSVITSEEGQKAYARAIVDATIEFFDIPLSKKLTFTPCNKELISNKETSLFNYETNEIIKTYPIGTNMVMSFESEEYYQTFYSNANTPNNVFLKVDWEEEMEDVEECISQEDYDVMVASKNKDINELQDKIVILSNDNMLSQSTILSLKNKNETLTNTKEQLESLVTAKEKAYNALCDVNTTLEKEIEDLKSENDVLKQQIEENDVNEDVVENIVVSFTLGKSKYTLYKE